MTVTYLQIIQNENKLSTLKLLFTWRGGIFQAIWIDLLIFLSAYAGISCTYRFVLFHDENNKQWFEKFCVYFHKYEAVIPLGFVLGFFVTQIVGRWWEMFNQLSWPDTLALNLAIYLPGGGAKKAVRRYVVRLVNLASIMCLRRVSSAVARRFPTDHHLVEAGLMTKAEMTKMENINREVNNVHQTSWYPLQLAQARLLKSREQGWISSDWMLTQLQDNINRIAFFNGNLLCYAWVNIPLIYTQLVTVAVNIYFMVCLFSRQYLQPTLYTIIDGQYVNVGQNMSIPGTVNVVGYTDNIADFYFPLFTVLEFIFYIGWLKVALILLNPFGDDEEDFDINYIIDRNYQVSFLMVNGDPDDEDSDEIIIDTEDENDNIVPVLPHTKESAHHADRSQNFLTTDIIKKVVDNLDRTEPLFVPTEIKEADTDYIMFSRGNSLDTDSTAVSTRDNTSTTTTANFVSRMSNFVHNIKPNQNSNKEEGGIIVMDP